MNISPYLLAFFAMACYALLQVLAKKLQFDTPPLAFIAVTMAFLCVFAAIASFYIEKDFSIQKMDQKMWIGLIVFSVVNFIAFTAYLVVITKIPVTEYQLIGLATPVVGAIFAYWMLGEEFKFQYLVGLVFIAIGLFIALRKTSS